MLRFALLACVLSSSALAARPAPHPIDCDGAIAVAENVGGTAPGLLHAIGVVESGRRDPRTGTRRPWPWTVSAEGIGTYYANKADAITAVQALQARGISSIDVGCMQVNLFYHPTAFRSLDEAFDPVPNARYAARFLTSLYARTRDWPAAAAAYHSFTPGPAAQYAKLISAVWAGAPVPVVQAPDGREIVELPGGGELRMFRTASDTGRSRVFGVMN
ncbi:MAG: transglycosylase SLT domain-containing protein [Janthinobacterium lividum]